MATENVQVWLDDEKVHLPCVVAGYGLERQPLYQLDPAVPFLPTSRETPAP